MARDNLWLSASTGLHVPLPHGWSCWGSLLPSLASAGHSLSNFHGKQPLAPNPFLLLHFLQLPPVSCMGGSHRPCRACALCSCSSVQLPRALFPAPHRMRLWGVPWACTAPSEAGGGQ